MPLIVAGQSDPGLRGQVARLLQLAVDGLTIAGRPVPDLTYRAKAEPPLDCELLTAHVVRRFAGMPGAQRATVTPQHTPGSSCEVMFTLARPIEGLPEATREPTPELAMDNDGVTNLDDNDALWNAFEEASQDPTRYLNRMALGELTSTPEGDMMALRLSIQVLVQQSPRGAADV